jgi:hypothetical protein
VEALFQQSHMFSSLQIMKDFFAALDVCPDISKNMPEE